MSDSTAERLIHEIRRLADLQALTLCYNSLSESARCGAISPNEFNAQMKELRDRIDVIFPKSQQ